MPKVEIDWLLRAVVATAFSPGHHDEDMAEGGDKGQNLQEFKYVFEDGTMASDHFGRNNDRPEFVGLNRTSQKDFEAAVQRAIDEGYIIETDEKYYKVDTEHAENAMNWAEDMGML